MSNVYTTVNKYALMPLYTATNLASQHRYWNTDTLCEHSRLVSFVLKLYVPLGTLFTSHGISLVALLIRIRNEL